MGRGRCAAGILAVAVLLLVVGMLAPSAARADAIDDALAHFAADKFPETERGVDALVATGAATTAAVFGALADSRLFYAAGDRAVFFAGADGALFDAKTGARATGVEAGSLKKVRLNNAIRSRLAAALGSLDLLASDPGKRLAAAEAVFRSHDAKARGAIEAALAKETDPAAARALTDARAAIVATSGEAPEGDRLAAVGTLRARGDGDALALLNAVLAVPDASPAVVKSAKTALSSVQTRLALWQVLQNVLYGLSLGSVLLLAAIGLAITFGVMGIINMAHGEMVMLGAYTTFVVQQGIESFAPGWFDASLLIAVPLAFAVSGAVGIAIERLVIRHLYGRPLETLLATWGVSLILQQLVRTFFGANNREVGAPAFMAGSFKLGGLEITSGRMWIVVFTIAVFLALQAVLKATPFGLKMRAVTQNRRMASAMGIATGRIDALAFGLGSGIAGIAGVALSQIGNVSPSLGQSYIIDSFMVVVFGGVGNLWGTLVAALTLGIANKFLEPVAGAVLAKIAILVFIILFIQKRPRGLFALRGRAVEA